MGSARLSRILGIGGAVLVYTGIHFLKGSYFDSCADARRDNFFGHVESVERSDNPFKPAFYRHEFNDFSASSGPDQPISALCYIPLLAGVGSLVASARLARSGYRSIHSPLLGA
jgi:hypothetical protein